MAKTEGLYKIKPLNGEKEVPVAISTSVYSEVMNRGHFVLMDHEPNSILSMKLVSLWTTLGEPVVIVWEIGDDGIYRPGLDINLKSDDTISIERKMKDGSQRRTDVKIYY